MGHEWVLWVLVTASALHVVEEHAMGWQGWASRAFGPRLGAIPSWSDFWATNALLIVFGVAAAMVGWAAPAFALGFAALCLINSVFFHILPSVRAGRPNPGLFSACLFYLPIGIWAYLAAGSDGALSLGTALLSAAIGAVAMAAALAMVAIGSRIHYEDVAAIDDLAAPGDEPAAAPRGL